MRPSNCWTTLALVLYTGWVSYAAQAPQPVPVRIDVRDRWVALPDTPDDSEAPDPVVTRAAVDVQVVVDPDTGKPYLADWPFTCPADHVHRAFHLDKREFILGEPILVEYRVSVEGPGEFSEGAGGNYRSRGRDDNFLFLLRREDGTWVKDVHPFGGGMGGGLGGGLTAREGHPISLWAAVQRWCAIEEPGRYDLYCFYVPMQWQQYGREEAYRAQIPAEVLGKCTVDQYGNLFKKGTQEKTQDYVVETRWNWADRTPSPLAGQMPEAVTALMKNFTIPTPGKTVRQYAEGEVRQHVDRAGAFVRFPLVIRRGSPDEVKAMVASWVQRSAAAGASQDTMHREHEAVLDGMYFVLQPCFLDAVRDQVKSNPDPLFMAGRYWGLSFNPEAEATAILLGLPRERFEGCRYVLGPSQNPGVMADFVALLGDGEPTVRERALELLRRYSGYYFFAGPDGAPLETLGEGQMKEARVLWREWWRRNADAFTPVGFNGIWGYIDKTGAFAIPPRYARATAFHDGRASVSYGDGWPFHDDERFLIDLQGTRLAQPDTPYGPAPLNPVRVGERWGYEDTAGKLVIPARFDWAGQFSDGLAAVKEGDNAGYIDTGGAYAIPAKFESYGPFSNGQAVVKVDGLAGVIDRHGAFLLKPTYVSVGPIVEGLAQFQVGDRFGFIDEKGKVVIEPRFTRVQDFQDGLAWVETTVEVKQSTGATQQRPRSGFIDRQGRYVVQPEYFDCQPFAEGLSAVRTTDYPNPTWGYIDRTGKMVIPPQFSAAHSFFEGVAAVCLPGPDQQHWGYINPSGKMVIPATFASAGDFREGLAPASVPSPHFRLKPEDFQPGRGQAAAK